MGDFCHCRHIIKNLKNYGVSQCIIGRDFEVLVIVELDWRMKMIFTIKTVIIDDYSLIWSIVYYFLFQIIDIILELFHSGRHLIKFSEYGKYFVFVVRYIFSF